MPKYRTVVNSLAECTFNSKTLKRVGFLCFFSVQSRLEVGYLLHCLQHFLIDQLTHSEGWGWSPMPWGIPPPMLGFPGRGRNKHCLTTSSLPHPERDGAEGSILESAREPDRVGTKWKLYRCSLWSFSSLLFSTPVPWEREVGGEMTRLQIDQTVTPIRQKA